MGELSVLAKSAWFFVISGMEGLWITGLLLGGNYELLIIKNFEP
jgi:hypothetical protein